MPDTQTTTNTVTWQLVPDLVYLHNLIDQYYKSLEAPDGPNKPQPQDILQEINNQLRDNHHNLPRHIDFPTDPEGISQALTGLSQHIVTTQTPTPEYSQPTTTPAPEFSTPNVSSPTESKVASLHQAYWDTAKMLARHNGMRNQALEATGLTDNRSQQAASYYVSLLERLGINSQDIPKLTADYLNAQFAPHPQPPKTQALTEPPSAPPQIPQPPPDTWDRYIPPSLHQAIDLYREKPTHDNADNIAQRLTAHPKIQDVATRLQEAITKTPQEQHQILQELKEVYVKNTNSEAHQTLKQLETVSGPEADALRQNLITTHKTPLHQAIESELRLGGVKQQEAESLARRFTEVMPIEAITAPTPINNLSELAVNYQVPLAPAHQAILNQPIITTLANQEIATTSFVSLASPTAVEAVIQNAPLMAQVDQFLAAKGFPPEALAKFPAQKVNLALSQLVHPDPTAPIPANLGPTLHQLFANNSGSLTALTDSLLSPDRLSVALQAGSFPPISQPKLGFFQRIRFFFSPSSIPTHTLIETGQSIVSQIHPPPTTVSFLVRLRKFLANPFKIFQSIGVSGPEAGGSSLLKNLGQIGGNFGGGLKTLGNNLVGAAGNGLKGLMGRLGVGAATQAGAAGAAGSTGITAAAAASWELWVPVMIIGLFVVMLYFSSISHTSPKGIARSEMVVIGATAGGGVIEENPYIGLAKTASPENLEDPTGTITYTYTVVPKQGALTNVTIAQDQVSIIQENSSRQSSLTPPTPPSTIESTFTSPTFTFNLDDTMDDAVIVNTLTLTALDPNGDLQTVVASATTLIGNPPTGCFVFSPPPFTDSRITAGPWPQTLLSWENSAAARITGAFTQPGAPPLCSAGAINVYFAVRGTDVTCGGWSLGGGNVAIDSRSATCTSSNALYTLAHEAGHVLADRNGNLLAAFRQTGFVSWTGTQCVNSYYPFPISSDSMCYSENFAEGMARCIAGYEIDTKWCAWYNNNVFNQ